MAHAYRGGHMIAAMEVPDSETHRYGVFHTSGGGKGALVPATGLVEKAGCGERAVTAGGNRAVYSGGIGL